MAISTTDIELRYSGGLFNNDPLLSIGGSIAQIAIEDNTLDNLFDSNPERETDVQYRDFRAIYVINNNTEDIIYDVLVYISKPVQEPSEILMGVIRHNEIQTISFVDFADITSGSFTLKLGNYITNEIAWDSDTDVFGANIQSAIRNIPGMIDVEVYSPTIAGDAVSYPIYFEGDASNKLQPTLSVNTNQLAAAGQPATITIAVSQAGSPINDVAVHVAFRNNPPAGVSFIETSPVLSVNIGTLRPGEYFPIWLQRTIPAANLASQPVSEDSFEFGISGMTGRS